MGSSTDATEVERNILVTGFGAFKGHDINASWEAVRTLSKMKMDFKRKGYHLETIEIPVTYEAVKTQVPLLWKQLTPFLVVHVGVSDMAQELTLEQIAHNDEYIKIDANGKLNDFSYCKQDGSLCLESGLKMDIICDKVNNSECGILAVTSKDAGHYLCDFIYYTSLYEDKTRVAFIHVPVLDNPYSVEDIAIGIREAIYAMLSQLEEKHTQLKE